MVKKKKGNKCTDQVNSYNNGDDHAFQRLGYVLMEIAQSVNDKNGNIEEESYEKPGRRNKKTRGNGD